MRAVHLQTEYLTEPVGIDIVKPGFYWNCTGGLSQSAYQITVKISSMISFDFPVSFTMAYSSLVTARYPVRCTEEFM